MMAVIGGVAGSGLTYYLMSDEAKVPTKNLASREAPASIKPDKSKENTEASVATIGREFEKYLGLKVTALGKVSKTDDSKDYVLIPSTGPEQTSLLIDTSELEGNIGDQSGKNVKLSGTVQYIDIGNGRYALGIKAFSVKPQ